MTDARRGDILIRLDADATGKFVTIARMRITRFVLSADRVDIMSGADEWRRLLEGAGMRSASVSGRGDFKDAASGAALLSVFLAGAPPAFQLTVPNLGRIQGAFHLTALEYICNHDDDAVFEISLESAGPLAFEAARP